MARRGHISVLVTAAFLGVMAREAAGVSTTVAWYRMGEDDPGAASGNTANNPIEDSSANGMDLWRTGPPTYSNDTPHAGSTLSMDLEADNNHRFMRYGELTTATDNFGVEAWVKIESHPDTAYRYIFHNNKWGIGVQGGNFATHFDGRFVLAHTAAPLGTWIHVAMVRDDGDNRFFTNGVEVAFGNDSTPGTPNGDVCIGGYGDANDIDGMIDEVRVFTFNTGEFEVGDLLYPAVPRVETTRATGVLQTSATLNGTLYQTTGATYVWAAYGPTDGKTNKPGMGGAWSNFVAYAGGAQQAVGALAHEVTGLSAGTRYYFRFYASNATWDAWSSTVSFNTPSGGIVAQDGTIFNPRHVAAQSALTLASGESIIIDTDTLTITGDYTGSGTNGYSQSGLIRMGVFGFDSIDLQAGSTVTVTGNQGLALLSLGDVSIATTISVNGTSNESAAPGEGGPGAEGGVRHYVYSSAPPGDSGGDAGAKMFEGVGYGGGAVATGANLSGGGGGYGGAGGNGGGAGGTDYPTADLETAAKLVDLYGGSGGGGAGTTENGRGGAGGGGSIQITTRGALEITADGSLEANGGTFFSTGGQWGGGAGSGGGILLAAQAITVDGTVEATGGDATDSGAGEGGGGGGGGRVAFYSRTDWGITMESPYTNAPAGKVLIDGGTGASVNADDGGRGTFYAGPRPALLGGGGTVIIVR